MLRLIEYDARLSNRAARPHSAGEGPGCVRRCRCRAVLHGHENADSEPGHPFIIANTYCPGLLLLTRTVRDQARMADNVMGAGGDAERVLLNYLEWHEAAERALLSVVEREDASLLLHTPRHWTLRAMSGGEARLHPEVQLMLTHCADVLREWAKWSEAAQQRWGDSVAAVPDTDYLLHCGKRLNEIDWASEVDTSWRLRVVLTVTVLDQIDRHKRSRDPTVRTRARQLFKEMREMGLLEHGARVPLHAGDDPQQRHQAVACRRSAAGRGPTCRRRR